MKTTILIFIVLIMIPTNIIIGLIQWYRIKMRIKNSEL